MQPETPLKAMLDNHAIENVTMVGNMSHMCIDAVTRASNDLGFKTTVVHDACATHDLEFNGVKASSLKPNFRDRAAPRPR